MICSNCGAAYDENLPKCPYCDALNPSGAEKEYLEKLQDIQEDLEDLHEVHSTHLKKEAKGIGRVLKWTMIILGIFVLLGVAGHFVIRGIYPGMSTEETYVWKRETFPKLDAYYENEDYDSLYEEFDKALNKGIFEIYDWDHADLVSALRSIRTITPYLDDEDAKTDDGLAAMILSIELEVELFDQIYPEADEKDVELVKKEGEHLIDDRRERFPMSEKELTNFIGGSPGYLYIDYLKCEEYAKEYIRRK